MQTSVHNRNELFFGSASSTNKVRRSSHCYALLCTRSLRDAELAPRGVQRARGGTRERTHAGSLRAPEAHLCRVQSVLGLGRPHVATSRPGVALGSSGLVHLKWTTSAHCAAGSCVHAARPRGGCRRKQRTRWGITAGVMDHGSECPPRGLCRCSCRALRQERVRGVDQREGDAAGCRGQPSQS